ncbi:MAG: hypothetical protein PHW64_09570 [Sulfuricurvum sp.]|nr:hypothetical protein [Sulfuricurvum sp.]
MIYLITALDAEARPLCDRYKLKRSNALPYTLYTGENTVLLVSGMGKTNAAMAVSALLGWRLPSPGDILINMGICGAPVNYPIGDALLIHQIIDGDRHYYPDILYAHSLAETSLICVDIPQSSPQEYPVDMESAGIFQAASKFFKLHQIGFLKIVSDHCAPDTVTKEGVIRLIASHLDTLDYVSGLLTDVQTDHALFSQSEREEIDSFKSHFTKSQGDMLEDALCFARLKNSDFSLDLFPSSLPNSKRERGILLENLITRLTL